MSKEEAQGWPDKVTLLGKQHATVQPSFGTNELLTAAFIGCTPSQSDVRFLFAHAAIIGHCTSVGAAAKERLVRHGFDVLAYGEAVYTYLREQGATSMDVSNAGHVLLKGMQTLRVPLEKEVAAAADFSEGAGAST